MKELYNRWHEHPSHAFTHWAVFIAVSFLALNFLLTQIESVYASHGGTHIITPWDTIPDFCENPTRTTVSSGNWSDPSIWSGNILPSLTDKVVINSAHTVTYDSTSGVADCLGIKGTLTFKTDTNTSLKAGTILVYDAGHLIVGTQSSPISSSVTAEIVIADKSINVSIDPSQYGTGLLAWGEVKMHGAVKDPTFIRLAAEPTAGQTTLVLSQTPTGWKVGDRVHIPGSKQSTFNTGFSNWPHAEEGTIQAINGTTLTLSSPLQHPHPGAKNNAGVLQTDMLPHVMNLSRNILIRPENPSGTRGHILLTYKGNYDLRYVQIKELGRTTFDTLNANSNHIGRYPLHIHHVMGPAITPANGYQYTLIGLALDGGSNMQHRFKWGITVHDAHYGLIKDNVIYNYAGSGIMTEQGNESYNVFEHNMVSVTRGVPGAGKLDDRAPDYGWEGANYWFAGYNNYIRDNVAAQAESYAYVFLTVGNGKIPNFKGADTSVSEQYTSVDPFNQPILEFDRNEAYAVNNGLTLWNLGAACCTWAYDAQESLIKDLKLWHIGKFGTVSYAATNVVYDGLKHINEKSSVFSENTATFMFGDYIARKFSVRNSRIENLALGVHAPPKPGDIRDAFGNTTDTPLVENTYISAITGINNGTENGVTGGGTALPPRKMIVNNMKWEPVAGYPHPQGPIYMYHDVPHVPNPNISIKNELVVYNYQQQPGVNFQVYFKEQRPDYVMENGHYGSCPTPGMTNSECMAAHGVAIAGVIAPCLDDTTYPEIFGFVCPLGSSAPTPPPPPSPDIQAPMVSITSPTNGASVSGTSATISANASDNVGVTGVQFKLDGTNLGSEDFSSPFTTNWNTTQTSNGSHTLIAVTRDGAGNRATSSPVLVIVSNSTPPQEPTPTPTSPPTLSTPSITIKQGTATIIWTTNTPATSRVEYGLTSSFGSQSLLNSSPTTSHTRTITNLSPGTYHVRAISTASSITGTSTNLTFTVRSKPPVVTLVSAGEGSVILNWSNPSFPGFSGVAILKSTTGFITTYDPAREIAKTTSTTYTDHAVNPSTTYYYTIFVYDDQDNYSDPVTVSFTTPAGQSSSGGGGGSSGGGGGGGGSSGGGGGSVPSTPSVTAGTSTAVVSTGLPSNFSSLSYDEQVAALLAEIARLQALINAYLATQGAPACTFTRSLSIGTSGEDVRCLQRYLNSKGFTVSQAGAGSRGQESLYYGPATKSAVARWQGANSLQTDGHFGPLSRAKYAEVR